MAINDRNRSRRTYSFFRAQPTDVATTVVSGGVGIEVTGTRDSIVISSEVLPFNVTPIVTGSYTGSFGELVRYDPVNGSFGIELPSAAGQAGLGLTIKNVTTASTSVTVSPVSGETIDGELNTFISSSFGTLTAISDNTNWMRFPAS